MDMLGLAGEDGKAAESAIGLMEGFIAYQENKIADKTLTITSSNVTDLIKGLCFLLNTVTGYMGNLDEGALTIYNILGEVEAGDDAPYQQHGVTLRLLKNSVTSASESAFYMNLYSLEDPVVVLQDLMGLFHMITVDWDLATAEEAFYTAREIISEGK